MSFPYHDRNWVEVGDFLEARVQAGQRVLAPDLFWWRLPRSMDRWVTRNLHEGNTYDWVVVHKGEIERFPRRFLEHVTSTTQPVLANDVFVVFAGDRTIDVVDPSSPHLLSFIVRVAQLPDAPLVENPYEHDANFGGDTTTVRYPDLDDGEMREAENAFFRSGGYEYRCARDRGYFADIRQHMDRAMDRWRGTRVLDLACGQYGLDPPADTTLIRVDFAIEGLRQAIAADDGHAASHAAVDAHHLSFPDKTFAAVAFMDSSEHVRDIAKVVSEIARVLQPSGELMITFSNRNSLHLLLTRKLGYPEFLTNHHHIREFTPDEMIAILAEEGFEVIDTAGVGFYSFWGVPGIDEVVRPITDDDDEIVEVLRELGRRAGIDYAYVGVVLARKRESDLDW